MQVRVFADAARASRAAAHALARQLTSQPTSVLGLPSGLTTVPIYEHLARLGVDFARVHVFGVDEFVALPPAPAHCFRGFIERHLLASVNIPRAQVHFLDGAVRDLDAECARFERDIASAGGIDLLMLGIGANGHIGFNEPAAELVARTHRARLKLATRQSNAHLFGGRTARVPREALSMGIGTILSARTILLVATGREKARAIGQMLTNGVTPAVPASFLQLHPRVGLILDRAAARRL
jgi:glucosamine-6-phosphate deaminase